MCRASTGKLNTFACRLAQNSDFHCLYVLRKASYGGFDSKSGFRVLGGFGGFACFRK